MLATYGEGDPTDNAISFLAELREMAAQGKSLSNLRFIIFGLGNKNYRHFNKVAIDVEQLLCGMGATRIGELGLGDDSCGGTEENYISWKASTDRHMAEAFGLTTKDITYVPRTKIQPVKGMSSGSDSVYQGEPTLTAHRSGRVRNNIQVLQVAHSEELIESSAQRHCIHMEFALEKEDECYYETGDYLQVWPMNPDDEIESLLRLTGLWSSRDEVVDIGPVDTNDTSKLVPTPTTPMILLRHYLDITGTVSREILGSMDPFIADPGTKIQLQKLTKDVDAFRTEVTNKCLTLAAVLERTMSGGKSAHIPLTFLLDNLKKLQPRSYSISSSSMVSPRSVAITALAVAEEFTPRLSSRPFRGIASHYILDLHLNHTGLKHSNVGRYSLDGPRKMLQGSKIFARIRKSEFKMPADHTVPIIMIASGTGVAPFRAFVQERMLLLTQGCSVGKMVLIVGHRSPEEDYYYRGLWEEAQSCLGSNFEIHQAFSRAGHREYVQDVVARQKDFFMGILGEGSDGALYICGSSKMASSVKEELKGIWATSRCADRAEMAESWLEGLSKQKRLQVDSWG